MSSYQEQRAAGEEAYAQYRDLQDRTHHAFDKLVLEYHQNPTEELFRRREDAYAAYISLAVLSFRDFQPGRDYVTEAIENRRHEESELETTFDQLLGR